MADRTYYYLLAFEGGDLQDIEAAAGDSFGVVTEDLREAEKDARDWIRRMLTAQYGWVATKAWDEEWVAEGEIYPDHVPRAIRMLAQKMSSAFVWRRVERFNRQVESDEEGAPMLMSQVLMREAQELWDSIVSSGILIYEDGAEAIDLDAARHRSGIGVSGSAFVFFADHMDESTDGVRPAFSTEGLYKELNV